MSEQSASDLRAWFTWRFALDALDATAEAKISSAAAAAGLEYNYHDFDPAKYQYQEKPGVRQVGVLCPEEEAIAFFERLVALHLPPNLLELAGPLDEPTDTQRALYQLCMQHGTGFDAWDPQFVPS